MKNKEAIYVPDDFVTKQVTTFDEKDATGEMHSLLNVWISRRFFRDHHIKFKEGDQVIVGNVDEVTNSLKYLLMIRVVRTATATSGDVHLIGVRNDDLPLKLL